MCLVCFINAEESRLKKPSNSSATTSTESDAESSDNGSESDTLSTSHAIHYFAIGSMTNMTAMSLRELTPISSQPALLKNHRLLFRGSGGMATAENNDDLNIQECDAKDYPFNGIHGVLHLLTGPQMKILDDFEGGYRRRARKVMLYDGRTEVNAYVYQMDRTPWKAALTSLREGKIIVPPKPVKHELPTERYLDIIAQGCESHGVDPKWVQFIRTHACIPRKDASEFCSFSASMTSATVPIIPWEQVRACNGVNGAKLWIVINNKVLEFMGDVTSFFPFGYFIKHNIGGTDFTVKFAKGFFEPKYIQGNHSSGGAGGSGHSNFSSVTSSSQLGNEHRAWVEDQFAAPPPVLASSKWALVGVVDASIPVSDPVALTRNSTFGMRRTKLISCASPLIGRGDSSSSLSDAGAGAGAGAGTGVGAALCGTKRGFSTATSVDAFTVTATEVLDLTADINAGYNHFFISGTTSGVWIVPDGIHPGQTLYVRKTALEDFDAVVVIRIRNQSLGSPNERAASYEMAPDVYYLSWCWDGAYWYLEQIGRAQKSAKM